MYSYNNGPRKIDVAPDRHYKAVGQINLIPPPSTDEGRSRANDYNDLKKLSDAAKQLNAFLDSIKKLWNDEGSRLKKH